MLRFGFFCMTAALVATALALWDPSRRPVASEPASASANAAPPAPIAEGSAPPAEANPPEEAEDTTAPDSVVPEAPPVVASPPSAPKSASGPGDVATPSLEEEEVVLAGAVSEFDDGFEDGSELEDARIDEAESADATPVDVERSGDLVRRMLALYGAMRD